MSFLKSILKSGVDFAEDSVERRRIMFFNYLILFCMGLTIILSIVTGLFGIVNQALISVTGTFFLTIPLILNHKGYASLSRFVFLGLSIILVSTGTYINLQKGFYVEAENILLALMVVTMFFMDGWKKHFSYWLTFGIFLSLKVFAITSEGVSEGYLFALTIINNSIIGIVMYAFLAAFRSILVKALDRNDQHERRLFSMIDNVPVFMALFDKEGQFILANEKYANNFQVGKKEIVGKRREEVLPPKVLENQRQYFIKAQSGESVSFLQETTLPNGISISANGKYEPVMNDQGEVESITVCVDDVTPLVKAQEALKVANETKDKLFSIVAHDIKSPLNMFYTFLEMSEQSGMSSDDFFKYQKTLKQKLESLTGTIDELLDWSRMQLGGINAYPEMVNVSDIVNENLDLFESLIKKKQIDLSINTPKDALAWIDENHFKVVLRNLIHNAIKFTNGGGKIEVSASQNSQETIVSVEDSGVGMDSATIDSIIKKEIQKSQAGTDREIGTGLGLSLSFGLLEKNNCEVSVTSEINKGTKFEIKIPNS